VYSLRTLILTGGRGKKRGKGKREREREREKEKRKEKRERRKRESNKRWQKQVTAILLEWQHYFEQLHWQLK
jgi:hypothetical protein